MDIQQADIQQAGTQLDRPQLDEAQLDEAQKVEAQQVDVQQKKPTEKPLNKLLNHPNLWRAKHLQSSRPEQPGIDTGYADLDALLPGSGWPSNGLVEFLLPCTGIGELRMLAPALKTLSQTENRWVAWVNPPFVPYAPALESVGIDISKILLIHPPQSMAAQPNTQSNNRSHKSNKPNNKPSNKHWQDTMWSLERAAKSGACSVVLAWVDEKHLTLRDTQRLQNAARQGQTLVCLMRPQIAVQQASMAELRIALQASEVNGQIKLDIIKRRGGWPVNNLLLPIATTTGTQHREHKEIYEQLSLWRTSISNPTGTDPKTQSAANEALATEKASHSMRLSDVHAPQPAIH